MAADTIEREILIEAPVEVVWRVITEPGHIGEWFADTASLDARPGGRGEFYFNEKATNGPAVTVPLTVESVEPPHRFSFRWAYPEGQEPAADNSLHVEFTLTAEDTGTRLRLVESGFQHVAEPGTRADHESGWTVHLGRLRDHAVRVGASA